LRELTVGELLNDALRVKVPFTPAQSGRIVYSYLGLPTLERFGIRKIADISANNQAASIRLCALGNKFREVLQITRLLTVFDVYDTQAAAISSFLENNASAAAAE
jgi:hypothetical protein